jgi:hypothetical protein
MQGFENGAEIGRWNFDSTLPDISSVDVKRYFPIGIAIAEPALGYMAFSPINESILSALLRTVADVIRIFSPCFAPDAPPPRPLR